MKYEVGEAIKKIQRTLDATDLVVLARRDWDKIQESPLADGVTWMTLRSVD